MSVHSQARSVDSFMRSQSHEIDERRVELPPPLPVTEPVRGKAGTQPYCLRAAFATQPGPFPKGSRGGDIGIDP